MIWTWILYNIEIANGAIELKCNFQQQTETWTLKPKFIELWYEKGSISILFMQMEWKQLKLLWNL